MTVYSEVQGVSVFSVPTFVSLDCEAIIPCEEKPGTRLIGAKDVSFGASDVN